jgi:ribonucleoside-diphosphate reductase alpha chain
VRVTDEFMRAAAAGGKWQTIARTTGKVVDTLDAAKLWDMVAESAWACADPGVQYDTTINHWHTCPNTGNINASNPCVTGDTLVSTSEGWLRIDSFLDRNVEVVGADGELHAIKPAFSTGTKPVYKLVTKSGLELKLTADHRVLTLNRGDVPACELSKDDVLALGRAVFGNVSVDPRLGEFLGLVVGDGCLMGEQQTAMVTLAPDETELAQYVHARLSSFKKEHAADGRAARDTEVTTPQGTVRFGTSARCVVDELVRFAVLDAGSGEKALAGERVARPVHGRRHGRQLRREIAVRRARQYVTATASANAAPAARVRHQGQALQEPATGGPDHGPLAGRQGRPEGIRRAAATQPAHQQGVARGLRKGDWIFAWQPEERSAFAAKRRLRRVR